MENNHKSESIASHVVKTFESFHDLENALAKTTNSDEPSEGAALESFLPTIENDFIRFKMWAGNQAAHRSDPSSLDHRLREAPHLQKQIIYLLKDICESLEDALSNVSENSEPQDQGKGRDQTIQDNDNSSVNSAQDEEFVSSDSDSDCDTPTPVLSTLLLDVREAIDCLLRLSVAIANPASLERFQKLEAGPAEDISFHEPHDIAYVKDRFPKSTDEVANALGKYITRRRQFFKYRYAHREKLAHGIATLASNKETGTCHTETVPETTPTSSPGHFKTMAKFGPQADVIDEDIWSDSGTSQTSYATSAGSAFEGTDPETLKAVPPLHVPPKPSAAKDGMFECPFCYRMIFARTRTSWKRHVFGDLRPYTCVLSHCTESNTDFDRRHNWQLHVSKYHWRSWSCPFKCHQPFYSAVDLSSHIKDRHLPTGDEEEIRSVTALGERPAPDDTCSHCLLCGRSIIGLNKYVKHLGKHLEQLALFALPSIETGDLEREMQQMPIPRLAVEERDEEETGSYGYDESPSNPHGLSKKALGKLPATLDEQQRRRPSAELKDETWLRINPIFPEQSSDSEAAELLMRSMQQANYDAENRVAEEDKNLTKLQFENESRTGTCGRAWLSLPSHEVAWGDSGGNKSTDEKFSTYLSETRTDPKGVTDLNIQADHSSDSGQGHPQQTRVPQEMTFLSQENRNEVTEPATKIFNSTYEQKNASTVPEIQSGSSPTKLADAKPARYQCDECSKSFSKGEYLRRHKFSHSREFLFCPVPECRKTFFRNDLLELHVSRHIEIQSAGMMAHSREIPAGNISAIAMYTSSYTRIAGAEYSPPQTPPPQDKTESPIGVSTCSNCFTQTTPLRKQGPGGQQLCSGCFSSLGMQSGLLQPPLGLKPGGLLEGNRDSGSIAMGDRSQYTEMSGKDLDEHSQLGDDIKGKSKVDHQSDADSAS
ncbi:unnamed protein product [Fusarium graminearum]|nr:unnamed protein product [Fusarium graminearum]